ncbi:MAG: hypothetical protein E7038_09435 [Lentisphaerae bacterium]|nr:hypothetical protein [Lentisphaerota bacterium]
MKARNLFFVLFAMLAVALSTGCDSPETTVEKFYDALYDGNFGAAKKYCSDDAAAALDRIIESLGDDPADALALYRKKVAFEKKYFRFLIDAEVAYQEKEEEKARLESEKQQKDLYENAVSDEARKDIQEAEARSAAEQAEIADAKIIYTRWSSDIVYKHYLKRIRGRWKIVKIGFGHALPDKLSKGE